MPGQYPNRIKQLPLFDGRFDAYKLEAKDSTVLFASYPAGTSIPPHTHDTDNHGVITRGELILTLNDYDGEIHEKHDVSLFIDNAKGDAR